MYMSRQRHTEIKTEKNRNNLEKTLTESGPIMSII